MPESYTRLSAQDATFLDLESTSHHQHIAATLVFESGPLRTREGGVDIQRIRDYVESRLHLLPRYRQRLARIPVENHPVWVDDPHFNLGYHVRHTALPLPGDASQLKEISGRVLSQQLDRERPLWEIWVVEGLDGGERFALVQKVHHCMIDGISGVDLMAILMSPDAEVLCPPAPPWKPRPIPSGIEMLTGDLARRFSEAAEAVRSAPEVLRDPLGLVGRIREGAQAVSETLGAGLHNASETPINQPLGPHRKFEWHQMDLARVKRVKQSLGGTVNDVVLATVAGALRRFLTLRRLDLNRLEIRANVPVSLRSTDERGTLGNRIALLMPELPVDEADPVTRLDRVHATMAELKHSRLAMGAEVLAAVSDWTSATLLSLAVRGAARGRPYNLVVTNVPGPQLPLYLLGARVEACYPVVNLLPNQGLGVALFSYAGTLFWGFTADLDQLPDLGSFVDAIDQAFLELEEAAEAEEKRTGQVLAEPESA
ncbi:MAG: wax ester/triacylglycerol synthase family O-acyltransferase [bacterium]|nr:wax ester/triacylglycerol synthase family O-acyltransferase [bacterium]